MESVVIPASAMVPRLNGKDSRWLTLEACPEFLQGSCPRAEEECKFAHPPSHVEIQNGRVTCCYDSIKGKCSRNNPPCKYLHPPLHLREQLLETGRQNLILKNLQVQSAAMASGLQQVVPMSGAIYPLVYENGTIKQVLPSNYQAMMLPGQYPYMQAQVPQQYAIQSSAGLPLQYLNAQQAGYPGRVIHMVNPSSATLPMPTLNATPAPAPVPMATLLPGGAGMYGQQVAALASPLAVANQMELCYMPDGSYTYQASTWSGSLGANDTRQITPVSSSTTSLGGSQYVETTAASSTDSTPSYSLASSIGMYPTQVAYHQQATQQLLEAASSNSRKRTRDALVAANGTGLVPMFKRPALMDSSSGLPVYQSYAGSSPYQSMTFTGLPPQQHYIPISLANNPTILPHF